MPSDPTHLAELIQQEARRQGLERGDYVATILERELRAEATGLEVAAAVRDFRRANPWFLKVSDAGYPAALADQDMHGLRSRGRRPDGTWLPSDPGELEPEQPAEPTMSELLRAALRPDDDAAARLQRLTNHPAMAGATDRGGTDADKS